MERYLRYLLQSWMLALPPLELAPAYEVPISGQEIWLGRRVVNNLDLNNLLGWAGCALLVAAFWTTHDRRLYWTMLAGLVLMSAHMYLVGAVTGAGGYALGTIRMLTQIAFGSSWLLVSLFSLAVIAMGIATWEGLPSLLILVATVAATAILFMLQGLALRLALIPVNVMLIGHHVLVGSVPALIMEAAISAGNVAMAWRLWRRSDEGVRSQLRSETP